MGGSDQADDDGQAVHGLKDALKVIALKGKSFSRNSARLSWSWS